MTVPAVDPDGHRLSLLPFPTLAGRSVVCRVGPSRHLLLSVHQVDDEHEAGDEHQRTDASEDE
jgi:hypothetical protein